LSPREDATEFSASVEVALEGGFDWKIHAENGAWPRWLSSGRSRLRTYGHTITRWGAGVESRRCLKKIRRYRAALPTEEAP
jgi:hypothetical protein